MSIALGIAAALIVALVAFIATRPEDFRVERNARIGAPREVVFPLINDLHQWGRWSPYEGRDPSMKKTYDGPAEGPGASYAWDGNAEVGAGRMTIVESRPGELVAMKLEFARPFRGVNAVNFRLEPAGDATVVRWIMDGKYVFFTKAMGLFMSMDGMIGKDFEQGLANLDVVARELTPTVG